MTKTRIAPAVKPISPMKVWLTTDTHFGHAKMVEYGRPADFEERIKNNLEAVVKPEDVLIHLGDVCIGHDSLNNVWFKAELGCRTWLVKGNHDRKSDHWYLEHGWDVVAERIDLDIEGVRTALTHEPLAEMGEADINIHGHLHNPDHHPDIPRLEHRVLISLEQNNYQPVRIR